jgi:hypothetical protein
MPSSKTRSSRSECSGSCIKRDHSSKKTDRAPSNETPRLVRFGESFAVLHVKCIYFTCTTYIHLTRSSIPGRHSHRSQEKEASQTCLGCITFRTYMHRRSLSAPGSAALRRAAPAHVHSTSIGLGATPCICVDVSGNSGRSSSGL